MSGLKVGFRGPGEGRSWSWNNFKRPGWLCPEKQRAMKGTCAFLFMTACLCCPPCARIESKSQGQSEAGVAKVRVEVASRFARTETD